MIVKYVLKRRWKGVYGLSLFNYCFSTINCSISIMASTNSPMPNYMIQNQDESNF